MQHPRSSTEFAAAFAEARRLHAAGEFKRARALYQDLADRNPGEDAPLWMLVELDGRDGRLASARRRLEVIAARRPDSKDARLALAGVAEELGDMDTALAIFRNDANASPNDPIALSRLATVLRFAGHLEEASALFRGLIDRWPGSSGGYVGLAAVNTTELGDGDVARMDGLAHAPATPIPERVQLLFALGEFWDRRQSYDRAFGAFDEGNRLQRSSLGGPLLDSAMLGGLPELGGGHASVADAEAHHANFVNSVRAQFSPQYLAHFAGTGHPSHAPIFIVGMPRSGSTLLEQILSSHPDVTGLGETSALATCFRELMPTSRAQITEEFSRNFYRRVGAAYLDGLRERGWSGHGRVIDKMLGNFAYVGTIQLALPNAIIIHSMRDPVDTCFSCFRQAFRQRNETTYDLGAIGRHYVLYRGLMDYWDQVLPGRVLHVQHEAILADPETEVRKLVAACGLPWNDACLRFHESSRPVRTASSSQVRKPISASGMARWKPYEKHLLPLFEALGSYAPTKA